MGVDFVVTVIVSIGIVIATIAACVIRKLTPKDVSGFIIVDRYDPDGPYMFLELSEDIETLCEREIAMLGIIVRDPSQD